MQNSISHFKLHNLFSEYETQKSLKSLFSESTSDKICNKFDSSKPNCLWRANEAWIALANPILRSGFQFSKTHFLIRNRIERSICHLPMIFFFSLSIQASVCRIGIIGLRGTIAIKEEMNYRWWNDRWSNTIGYYRYGEVSLCFFPNLTRPEYRNNDLFLSGCVA